MTRALSVVIACALAGCLSPADYKGKKNPDFHVIGHRGAPNAAAENTIASFEAAQAAGADAIETDLCVTSDAVVVVWHDLDPDDTVAVARQEGIEGLLYAPVVPPDGSPFHRRVDQLTLADFLATHGYARSGDTPDPAAPIATLDELLAWLGGAPDIRAIYWDVKVDVPEQAMQIVAEASAVPSRVTPYFLSPRREIVEAMIAVAEPPARVIWDFEGSGGLEGAEELGLRDITTGRTITRFESGLLDELEEMLDARHDHRIDTVVVWTIDDRMFQGVLLYYGVDGVMTNEPAQLHDLWQRTL